MGEKANSGQYGSDHADSNVDCSEHCDVLQIKQTPIMHVAPKQGENVVDQQGQLDSTKKQCCRR